MSKIQTNDNTIPLYVAFNRDNFLANAVDQPVSCSNYTLKTSCDFYLPTDDPDKKNQNIKQNIECETCKNFMYRDWYDTNPSAAANYLDTTERYNRALLYRWDLGIGILALIVGLYLRK